MKDNNKIVMIPRSLLHPHPDNPRKDLGDLKELADSIAEHGIEPYDLEYPFAWHFDCELPKLKEDEQSVDVLVTTALGFVKVTNFFIDYLGCPCFEDMDEAGEFVAWMPLPEGYKSEV